MTRPARWLQIIEIGPTALAPASTQEHILSIATATATQPHSHTATQPQPHLAHVRAKLSSELEHTNSFQKAPQNPS